MTEPSHEMQCAKPGCGLPTYAPEHHDYHPLYDHDYVISSNEEQICYHNTPDCRGHGDF